MLLEAHELRRGVSNDIEACDAYARSIKPDEEQDTLTHDSLRQILRQRMDAKARGQPIEGPAYL